MSFKEKILSKKVGLFSAVSAFVVSLPISAFAEGTGAGSIDIAGPLTSALNTTLLNTIACFSAIIPIGLTIFGAKFAWLKGVQFFSKIAAK